MRRLLALILLSAPAHADWITEFGIGAKLPSTSVVLLPECDFVVLRPDSEIYAARGGRPTASCGGDNPLFIGWPIAYERDLGGPWRYRIGWFHVSHIFDGNGRFGKMGGDGRETHLDCLCATATFNWSRR